MILEELLANAYADMGDLDTRERQYSETVKAEVEQTLYPRGRQENGTRQTRGPDGGRYSVDDTYDYSKPFSVQVDDWIKGIIPKYDSLLVGATPDVFQRIGFTALPMTINQKHVDYAVNGTKDADHHLGAKALKELPNALEHPIAIYASDTNAQRVVALVELNGVDGKVVAPIEIDGRGQQNHLGIDSNAIISLYQKTSNGGQVDKTIQQLLRAMENHNDQAPRLFYLDKNKAVQLTRATGVQFPGSMSNYNGFISSISDSGSNVNKRIHSQTETQQFKRWFGKSKVVDEQGKPRVVYHGTDADFWTFSAKDDTYWFSKNEDYAEEMMKVRGGNRIVKAYLSIQNPMYVKLKPGKFSDSAAEKPYITQAKVFGYDGLVIECDTQNELEEDTFYVAFSPDQIKSATDNIGTFDRNNPDIRYSVDDTEDSQAPENEIDPQQEADCGDPKSLSILLPFFFLFYFNPYPYRMRLEANGLSHGVKNSPPDCFTRLRRVTPFESPLAPKKSRPNWVCSFLVRVAI